MDTYGTSPENPSTGSLLPEHGVMHPQKPGTLRRVSNARSKYRGVCLNEMLLPVPALLANLLGVLIRFRERKYPQTADNKAMFMQVSVRSADRKFLRFLWVAEDAELYEYLRFIFGPACSPTCAMFALQKCDDDNVNDFPDTAAIFKQTFFMNDLFVSTDTVDLFSDSFISDSLLYSAEKWIPFNKIDNHVPRCILLNSRDPPQNFPRRHTIKEVATTCSSCDMGLV